MKEIVFSSDQYKMNWLRADYAYSEVIGPKELTYQVKNRQEGDLIYTDIEITNSSGKPYFTKSGSIGIAVPLADYYEDSETCLRYRCHTHIYCGDDVAYIIALRMGGEAPHLGLILTEGSVGSYSISRDIEKQSNDRGCFYLNSGPMEFDEGETKKISWVIFPHNGKDDFFHKASEFSNFVKAEAERYVLFPDEIIRIKITPSFMAKSVMVDGEKVELINGEYCYCYRGIHSGEKIFKIKVDEIQTRCRVYVHKNITDLVKKRCEFIMKKQQYHGSIKQLENAYLIYDNEEQIQVYRNEYDYNAGRERIGMGMLIAQYLQHFTADENIELKKSLSKYAEFVMREIVDVETGYVYNDIGYDDSFKRMYNCTWYALFFVELYKQFKKDDYIVIAAQIIKNFYKSGGENFYPIELPVIALSEALIEAGYEEEQKELQAWFVRHADTIVASGMNYPRLEVNYEQSIVAPAADILLKVYLLTKDEKYLKAGKSQMQVLELFNGMQPDYHLHEVAIRHWDGYWFGKGKQYGDTFPHHWSALTGNIFAMYADIMQDDNYANRAENSLRGVLPMIFPDGSASCAYLYPSSINGNKGMYYDVYANDQDWGLYFYLRRYAERK